MRLELAFLNSFLRKCNSSATCLGLKLIIFRGCTYFHGQGCKRKEVFFLQKKSEFRTSVAFWHMPDVSPDQSPARLCASAPLFATLSWLKSLRLGTLADVTDPDLSACRIYCADHVTMINPHHTWLLIDYCAFIGHSRGRYVAAVQYSRVPHTAGGADMAILQSQGIT